MRQPVRRGAVAEIDLGAVSHNLGIVRRIIGNRPVIAVVKADAYGHGAVEVSKKLVEQGVSCLAVAFTDEAIALRQAGVHAPILVLFDKDVNDYVTYDLIPVIRDLPFARKLSEEAKKRGRPLPVHIKVDTGMGRVGFHNDRALEEIIAVAGMDFLSIKGLMSHFSDSDIAEKSFAEIQLKRFQEIRAKLLGSRGHHESPLLCHMANSAATLSFKDAHLDAVRPGLMLYGHSPLKPSEGEQNSGLAPAMTVKTRILEVRRMPKGSPISYGRTFITRRDSLIAVLPMGYADGFSRLFSNNAHVLVRGKRAPVVGRVCMDLTMADVTEIEGVEEHDEAVILGKQEGEEITALEMAIKGNTIPYEILTTMGSRSRRIYV
jgi:alanine racemase